MPFPLKYNPVRPKFKLANTLKNKSLTNGKCQNVKDGLINKKI